MRGRHPGRGALLAATGAVLIVVSLLLDWVGPFDAEYDYVLRGYGATPFSPLFADGQATGFDAVGTPLLAILLATAALAVVAPAATVTVVLGVVATVATAARLVLVQPDGGLGDAAVELRVGAYLTALGIVLCAVGASLAARSNPGAGP